MSHSVTARVLPDPAPTMSRAAFPLIKFVPRRHALLPCVGVIIWKPRSTYTFPGVACKMDMVLTEVFIYICKNV